MANEAASVETEISEDLDLVALWTTRVVEARLSPDRTDESAALAELGKGRTDPLVALLGRHAEAAWRFALVISLDVEEATEASIDAWTGVIEGLPDSGRTSSPFHWELLRRIREATLAVGGAASTIDLTDGAPVTTAFVETDEADVVSGAFASLPADSRAGWWLTRIEALEPTDARHLLHLSGLTAAEHVHVVHEAFVDRICAAQAERAAGRCASASSRFGAYLRDELIDADIEVLERHLQVCDECTDRLDVLEDPVTRLLDQLAMVPDDLVPNLLDHLHQPLRVARF